MESDISEVEITLPLSASIKTVLTTNIGSVPAKTSSTAFTNGTKIRVYSDTNGKNIRWLTMNG